MFQEIASNYVYVWVGDDASFSIKNGYIEANVSNALL